MQSSECDERIESFASPPYFITLLNLNCGCILHGSTVEPRYNEPLDNGVLRMTNDFLYPSNNKIDEKEPRYNLVQANKFCQSLGPSLCRGPTVLAEDTVFMSPTGDGTDSSTSLEQRRRKAVPSLLSVFKY